MWAPFTGKGDGEEASARPGKGRAGTQGSSAGLVGGLMRAVSAENERKQHLDFERWVEGWDSG